MSRPYLLELAARKLRMPIGADVVLHQHPDPDAILLDGARLGAVIAEAARTFGTPLAFPIMDLKLEKAWLLTLLGVPATEIDAHHFTADPGAESVARLKAGLQAGPPPPRVAANLAALRAVAATTDLYPVGMSIGPFSLATKLMADPIMPVYLAGTGATAGEDAEVALVERALALSLTLVLHSITLQLAAGARAVFIAEPAANLVFFSPRQLATGTDIFERYALAPNRAIARLLEAHGADLLFHCCGELTDQMLDGFCSLRPALLSLGSSRRLWEDAMRVPPDIVLYGNLPSKRFYSDQLTPPESVNRMADELEAKMQATGHPFILGTECDTLHVNGCGGIICGKLHRMLNLIPPLPVP
jgi:hypothetical protein